MAFAIVLVVSISAVAAFATARRHPPFSVGPVLTILEFGALVVSSLSLVMAVIALVAASRSRDASDEEYQEWVRHRGGR